MKTKVLLMFALVAFVVVVVPTVLCMSSSRAAEKNIEFSGSDYVAQPASRMKITPLGEPIGTPGAPT
jgi:hypothetical protein